MVGKLLLTSLMCTGVKSMPFCDSAMLLLTMSWSWLMKVAAVAGARRPGAEAGAPGGTQETSSGGRRVQC